MSKSIIGYASKRSLAVLLLPLLAYMLISCGSAGEGSWVVLDSDDSDHPVNIYYMLEKKSPYGDNEKNEDPSGYQRICHLLPFEKQPTTNSDGKSEYASKLASETERKTCRLYKEVKKPPLVASSIPSEYADRIDAK